jgi:hypothetical protein
MTRDYLFALVTTALVATVTSPPAFAEIGRVKTTQGAVQIMRGNNVLRPEPGFKVEANDVVQTGVKGRISMTFIDNSRFAIGPNSRVAVDSFDYDRTRRTGNFVTRVDRGSMAVVSGQIAKSKKDAMKVRTPSSLLGVRGTRFLVEVPQ